MLAMVRRARGLAVVAAAGLVLTVPQSAYADPTDDAQARVDEILARVHDIQERVEAAEADYDQALGGLAHAVTQSSLTDRAQEDVAARTAAAEQAMTDRVRGLYMAGGTLSVYAAVLESGDVSDFQRSGVLMGRVMSANQELVEADQAVVDEATRRADAAEQATEASVATARDVAQVADRVTRLLAEQQELLDEAQAEVKHLEAVERARAALAAQAAAVGSITTSRLAGLQVMPPAEVFMALYRKAAPTCPGLSWTVLAAIGQVESGHGRNPSTSYAGAMGPMQFLPSTFRAYAVDGNDDGVADIMNPADAIFTAAHYLCANGAGRGPEALYKAIWHYNHADWYVQMVLRLSEQYAD
jgi:membrane-bound lytic murein transglycosylase B